MTASEKLTWISIASPVVKVAFVVPRMLVTVGFAPSTKIAAVLAAAYARFASLPAASRTVAVPRVRALSEMLAGPISVSSTVY